jgi:hypothetical protein
MTTKRLVLEQAANGSGVLGKLDDDCPVFILTANDMMAPGFVELWAAALRQTVGAHPSERHALKILTAEMTAKDMRQWQTRHGAKVPD